MRTTTNIALGAAAPAGATLLMQGLMQASAKMIPNSRPPMRQDPGEFMVRKAAIPENLHEPAKKSLQFGYGMTSGALYGAVRPRGGSPFIDGALLGLAVWAAGYLGWLPATDLMPPVTEHEPRQVIVPLIEHILFGIAVVSGYDAMKRTRPSSSRNR